jgi:thymidylate synthase
MYLMHSYDEALSDILNNGILKTNKRTGIKTLSVFGMLKKYRLDSEYFPIITKRKIFPKSVFAELLWFISGSTNNKDLQKLGCNFWTPWVSKDFEEKHNFSEGSFGPVYGFQLRHFGGDYGYGDGCTYGQGGIDQLQYVLNRIREDKSCRRIMWTLWNPKDLDKMRLPPCHNQVQILIDDDDMLSLILYQRSCDFPVGVPANIQFYSAMAIMLAQQTGCKPKEFIHMTADSHIYENQINAVKEYLERKECPDSPKLKINQANDMFSYIIEDFNLLDYNPLDGIAIPVAV